MKCQFRLFPDVLGTYDRPENSPYYSTVVEQCTHCTQQSEVIERAVSRSGTNLFNVTCNVQ